MLVRAAGFASGREKVSAVDRAATHPPSPVAAPAFSCCHVVGCAHPTSAPSPGRLSPSCTPLSAGFRMPRRLATLRRPAGTMVSPSALRPRHHAGLPPQPRHIELVYLAKPAHACIFAMTTAR
ncbi:hypothetical protein ZWY2020_008270 [Hordeum vulgare]|nr:hypothetical protein ZWY2020_008270 [Hordeum vulgare]